MRNGQRLCRCSAVRLGNVRGASSTDGLVMVRVPGAASSFPPYVTPPRLTGATIKFNWNLLNFVILLYFSPISRLFVINSIPLSQYNYYNTFYILTELYLISYNSTLVPSRSLPDVRLRAFFLLFRSTCVHSLVLFNPDLWLSYYLSLIRYYLIYLIVLVSPVFIPYQKNDATKCGLSACTGMMVLYWL